ncbi:MAG: SLBB domain-containing protein [Chitinispirillales bacterium]|jgi:protein involved in polysaccharide export with SLBB domain|nr:SLBB domain-containing protein [Chitinispirillales bacterium]
MKFTVINIFAKSALITAVVTVTTVFGQLTLPSIGFQKNAASSAIALDGNDYSSSQLAQQRFSPIHNNTILPSDNSIDEKTYLIGGGDVLFITAVESPSIRYTAAVDQAGKAYVQNVGLIDIGKTSYSDAKKAISDYISSKLKNPSEIYVTLIQTKEATVSFTGRVNSPGSYSFPGTTRLLDAVRAANGGRLPHASTADLRQVQCTNGDSTVYYDLFAYLYKGDRSQNPYIYPGDQIRILPTTAKVFISGAVTVPDSNIYPLKKGETLTEFLSMFTLDNGADTNNIIIHRSSENNVKAMPVSNSDYVLNDLDAITIPFKKNRPGIHTVSISGEIASPGDYPIIEYITTAKQIIQKAGGMKESANIEQAVIVRPSKNLPDRFNAVIPQTNAVRPERGTSVTMASITTDHTIIRLISYNADKIVLEPGDKIIVPIKDRFVYISGSVKRPGAYPFVNGKSSSYYITHAGGFSKNADKTNVSVYLKYDNAIQSIEPRCIEPGSIIVVPASVQYKFLSQVALPLVSATATTIGVILSIYNLAK